MYVKYRSGYYVKFTGHLEYYTEQRIKNEDLALAIEVFSVNLISRTIENFKVDQDQLLNFDYLRILLKLTSTWKGAFDIINKQLNLHIGKLFPQRILTNNIFLPSINHSYENMLFEMELTKDSLNQLLRDFFFSDIFPKPKYYNNYIILIYLSIKYSSTTTVWKEFQDICNAGIFPKLYVSHKKVARIIEFHFNLLEQLIERLENVTLQPNQQIDIIKKLTCGFNLIKNNYTEDLSRLCILLEKFMSKTPRYLRCSESGSPLNDEPLSNDFIFKTFSDNLEYYNENKISIDFIIETLADNIKFYANEKSSLHFVENHLSAEYNRQLKNLLIFLILLSQCDLFFTQSKHIDAIYDALSYLYHNEFKTKCSVEIWDDCKKSIENLMFELKLKNVRVLGFPLLKLYYSDQSNTSKNEMESHNLSKIQNPEKPNIDPLVLMPRIVCLLLITLLFSRLII